jgi:hypothetical protein
MCVERIGKGLHILAFNVSWKSNKIKELIKMN